MKGIPITQVEPLENGVIRVSFDTGNVAIVDLSPRFHTYRFGVLQKPEVWRSVDTNGTFIHWYRDGIAVVEMAYDELIRMILGESY